MDDIVTYLLSAELKNKGTDFSDTSRFKYVLQVSGVESKYKDMTFWEALAGKGREDDSLGLTGFRISIASAVLNLCPRLYKATDFIRRLSYAYDDIELMVDDNGQIQKIRNVEKLKSNWNIIKEMLEADYQGKTVNRSIKKMDDEISRWTFMNCVQTYLAYGLLFPGIPGRHRASWMRERDVIVSRYDEGVISECIFYRGSIDGNRKYEITGKLKENVHLQLEQFEGTLFVQDGEIIPNYATVKIRYRDKGIVNSWEFKLDRY
jgi:hypothetical protein